MASDDQLLTLLRDNFDRVNQRLDKLDEHITQVDREVMFAKGVAYVLSGGTAAVAWVSGWFK